MFYVIYKKKKFNYFDITYIKNKNRQSFLPKLMIFSF